MSVAAEPVQEIYYSARKRRDDPSDIQNSKPEIHASSLLIRSPVWLQAIALFATAWTLQGFQFAICVVIAQLALMTALQWSVLRLQISRTAIGPLGSLQTLRAVRIATIIIAFAVTLFL